MVRPQSGPTELDTDLPACGISFARDKAIIHAGRELLSCRLPTHATRHIVAQQLQDAGETRMKIVPLRSAGSDAGAAELDFPLPVADPSVRPMHRECVLKGCSYRSRFLSAAGWVLAALFLLTALAIGLQSARSQEALLKENAYLYQQIEAQREQRVTRPPAPDPAEKEPAEASAPSPPPAAAALTPRKSVPPKTSTELPRVPESDKWWNRP